MNELFQSICNENIWDANKTWNTSEPDFNRCLRHTILTWIPCGFLFVCSFIQILSIRASKLKNSSWRLLNCSRLLFSVLAFLANCVEFGYYVNEYLNGEKYSKILFISSAIKAFAFVILSVLLLHQKDKGVPSMATPWLFTFIHLICFVPTISQICLHSKNLLPFEVYFNGAYFVLLLVLFILSSFADLPSKKKRSLIEEEEEEREDTEGEENQRSQCPESSASFPSLFLFWWFTGLTYLGYNKPLVTDDIFDLNEEDKGEAIVPKFERNWYSIGADLRNRPHSSGVDSSEIRFENQMKQRSIIRTIAKTCWYDFTITILLLIVNYGSQLLSPLLLQSLLKFMSSNEPKWHGILIVVAMFAANIVSNLMSNAYFLKAAKIQVKINSCLTNMIYKKSLRLSPGAKKSSTSGEVVNLMAVDSQRIINVMPWIFFILVTPMVIAIVLWFMYIEMGYSIFGGVLVLAIVIPSNYFFTSLAQRFEVKQMKFKDERLKYINEALNGMKVLKLYAWEPSFIKLISEIRSKEMNACKMDQYVYAMMSLIWSFAPFLMGFITFAIYIFTDVSHVLTAEKIFVTLNLIDILNVPLAALPSVISYAVMAYVASKRIDKYLNATELEDYVKRDESDVAVDIRNGHFSWDLSEIESNKNNGIRDDMEDHFNRSKSGTLFGINLKVKHGSLHAIVGQVGSGKSSLLSAILGEMEKVNGSVNIPRRLKIAYVSQQAWIENLTLRANILFGKEYYKEKFEEIIDSCALRPDLEILPGGELTEIGEKGINLSGGQKQRVSLARAAYSDADLYLFDDPLSAVDSHVAKHLFDYLFSSKQGLLRRKTRILVTNRLDVLPSVDCITVMKNGTITEQGTYEELMDRSSEFAAFVNEFSSGANNVFEEHESTSDLKSEIIVEKAVVETKKSKKNMILVEAETVEVGRVKFSVYKKYFKMVSITWSVASLVAVVGYRLLQVTGTVWLSMWSSDNVTGDVEHYLAQRNYRFEVYAAIGFLQMTLGSMTNLAFVGAGLQAAIKLHFKLLNRIFRSPMTFFETTPLGRILNRFSKDMDSVDTLIPSYMKGMFDRIIYTIISLAVIAAQTGLFVLIILPLAVAVYFIQRIYIPTSRQLQRLNSITRSPIYAHFAQTLQGVSTIRAFDANERFIKESDKRVELNLICNYALNAASGWLNVFLNIFGSSVVLFVGLYAAIQRDSLTAGMVGLSITYSLAMTKVLTWLVLNIVSVETNIVSVERINEYCENTTEAEWINEEYRPPIAWPDRGAVEFDKYATRYRPGLDLVLKNVTATISGSEKIGIVGRTGAGKSTITLSLFRILEAVKGKIVIDGVNIANLGLHDLRSKLTIIPQDPVLFSGTLRFNLDPFDAYSDYRIWEALRHSHLYNFVSGLEKGLSHEIAEGGENLSVGQRQLICLARALLRKSKILILDEATAAVDLETDALIQRTIQKEFADCTTLTIAHRIQTILDCDRIIVMDKGKVVEFDSPSNLLSKENSMFYSLANNAGIVT